MRLYPLKFETIVKEKVWGGDYLYTKLGKGESADKKYGESWEISTVGEDISVVKNGFLAGNNLQELTEIYMADLVGHKVYEKFGLYFPLLIKFIDAKDDLSIQVHPDDTLGLEKYNSLGKTEMWYVMDAVKGAKMQDGFKVATTPDELREAVSGPDLLDRLNIVDSSKGDVFFIPAGRVHALMTGNVVIEIQQPSDITFRLYDYNRPDQEGNLRELHVEEGVEASNYEVSADVKTKYVKETNKPVNLAQNEFFTTNLIEFNTTLGRDYNLLDSFVILICSEGEFDIKYNKSDVESVKLGDSILLPADLREVQFVPKTEIVTLLEVYVEIE